MLTHWARDRTQGDGPIPLPLAVKMQTADTAKLLGLSDRGTIKVGMRADISKSSPLRSPSVAGDLSIFV